MAAEKGPRATRIEARLAGALAPVHLELVDESHMHSGPARETHFNLVVVSAAFDGLRPVRRHQLVYDSLQAELDTGLHALTLRTLSPSEWQAAQGPLASPSPACMGGGGGGGSGA